LLLVLPLTKQALVGQYSLVDTLAQEQAVALVVAGRAMTELARPRLVLEAVVRALEQAVGLNRQK
jgi:hypothetical protein